MAIDTVDVKDSSAFERRLYTGAAILAFLLMVVGFSKTYFLKTAFGTPSLSLLLHAHGLVLTLWFTLFVVQVRLVAARRLDLHRRLGLAGGVLAVLLVILGVSVAISAARQGHTPGPPPLTFLMLPLSIMAIFALCTGLAIHYRRRPDIHKRLMLLGSLNMLSPAIARIPLLHEGGVKVFIGLTVLIILVCVAVDTIRNRRLHPAFGWGASLLILSFPVRIFIAGTGPWLKFAAWLVS